MGPQKPDPVQEFLNLSTVFYEASHMMMCAMNMLIEKAVQDPSKIDPIATWCTQFNQNAKIALQAFITVEESAATREAQRIPPKPKISIRQNHIVILRGKLTIIDEFCARLDPDLLTADELRQAYVQGIKDAKSELTASERHAKLTETNAHKLMKIAPTAP